MSKKLIALVASVLVGGTLGAAYLTRSRPTASAKAAEIAKATSPATSAREHGGARKGSAKELTLLKRAAQIKIPAHLDPGKIKTINQQAEMFYRKTISRAQEWDAIIVGRPLQEFVNERTHFATYFDREVLDRDPNTYPQSEWTRGTFAVDQVKYLKSGATIAAGQTVPLVEMVGLLQNSSSQFYKTVKENCYEMKQGASYVVFVRRLADGTYIAENYNLGRFNTDGTDPEDEIGGNTYPDGTKSDKQKLRDELTAQYGVTFVVPTTTTPAIINLSPASAAAGGAGFTLTVGGTDFKNGAVIKFGGTDRQTMFLSATQLSAPILASDIATAGSVPVLVTNPDEGTSASFVFYVDDRGTFLPIEGMP